MLNRAVFNIKDIIQNRYGQVSEKASRFEFWSFAIFCYIMLGFAFALNFIPVIGPVFSAIIVMGLFIPYTTTAMRRLNDLGYNRLLALIPPALIASALCALAFASVYKDETLKTAYPLLAYSSLAAFVLLHALFIKKGAEN